MQPNDWRRRPPSFEPLSAKAKAWLASTFSLTLEEKAFLESVPKARRLYLRLLTRHLDPWAFHQGWVFDFAFEVNQLYVATAAGAVFPMLQAIDDLVARYNDAWARGVPRFPNGFLTCRCSYIPDNLDIL